MRSRAETALLERRDAVRVAQGRRRRTVALAVLASAATLAGGWWVLTGPPAQIDEVRVSGYGRADEVQLEAYLTYAARGETVVRPPVQRIRRAAAHFPWVQEVRVERDWPRGLVVTVTPAQPVAVVLPPRGAGALVTASGRVLGPAAPAPELPRIRIAGALPHVGATLGRADTATLVFAAALPEEVARRVRGLRAKGGALVGRLAAGPEIRVGPPERLPAKAEVLTAVLEQLSTTEERGLAYIDLSVPERPAIAARPTVDETQSEVES